MIGQVLHLKRETNNYKDKYAVAIVLEDCVVYRSRPIQSGQVQSQFESRIWTRNTCHVLSLLTKPVR